MPLRFQTRTRPPSRCRRPDRLAGAGLAAMERPATRRHFPGKGPPAHVAGGRPAARVEDRQPGPRLVVADHRPRPPVYHRRRGRGPGRLRLRPRGQAVWQAKNGRSWTGPYRSEGLLRMFRRQALPYQRPRPRGLPGGRNGQGTLGSRCAGAFPGAKHHLGYERVPAGRRPPGDRDAGRRKGPHGRPRQAQRSNGLDHAAAGRRPGLARLAAAVPPCREANRGKLLVGPRLRSRCRHRKAAVDRAAAESLRGQRGNSGLRRGEDLLYDSLHLRDLLCAATGRDGASAGKGLEHDPRYLHRHGAVGRRPALRQRLQEAQVLVVPGLEVRGNPLRVDGPDDRGRRLRRRAGCIAWPRMVGRPCCGPRPGGSRSTASSGSCPKRSAMPGHIRSCSTAGCTSATTTRFGVTWSIPRRIPPAGLT